MKIWLLITMLGSSPHIIDYYDTQTECEAEIIGAYECVEGTVIKNGLNEWQLNEIRKP